MPDAYIVPAHCVFTVQGHETLLLPYGDRNPGVCGAWYAARQGRLALTPEVVKGRLPIRRKGKVDIVDMPTERRYRRPSRETGAVWLSTWRRPTSFLGKAYASRRQGMVLSSP